MKSVVAARLTKEFGPPARETVKVTAWKISDAMGAVLQTDQPNRENAAYLWLPYPKDGESVPEIALEYPGEAGRHSGTYASAGLKRGEPALRLTIRTNKELDDVVAYMRAMSVNRHLPEVKVSSEQARPLVEALCDLIDPQAMPRIAPVKPRREAIPRSTQREVWQRDGGRCVECSTRERLCFDHIVPFSKGGSNSTRNLQLLCEQCNLSKGNRI